MEVLLNELSLNGQFIDEEEAIENISNIVEIMNILENLEDAVILTKDDIYSYNIMQNRNLAQFLYSNTSDENIAIMGFLLRISHTPPYWNYEQQHNCDNDNYSFDFKYIDRDNDICNESLAESCERDRVILSFKHNDFLSENLKVQRNEEDIDIYNIFEKNLFLDFLIFNSQIDLINYFNLRFENLKLIKNLNRYPLIEFIESQKIELQKKIIDRIIEFFYLKDNDFEVKENISKNLGKGLFELRGDFEDGIFRIFYFYHNDDIVFIDGFIKKSQKTPQIEIENARKIKKQYE